MNINERAAALSAEIAKATNNKVYHGPFKGLLLPTINGLGAPYYLGSYEHELHNIMHRIICNVEISDWNVRGSISPYKNILNVGCSFGYYAVGLARAIPQAAVSGFDINEKCIDTACEFEKLNDINKNLFLYNSPATEDDYKWADLIIMDIEGAEETELQPRAADVLVECHECIKPGITQTIIDRFSATHNIDIIRNKTCFFDLAQLFPDVEFEHFDHAIATWEGRAGPTPWIWMKQKDKEDDATLKTNI